VITFVSDRFNNPISQKSANIHENPKTSIRKKKLENPKSKITPRGGESKKPKIQESDEKLALMKTQSIS